MGLPITIYTDFKEGRFALPQNSDTVKQLEAYITENEKDILDFLLGCELADLLIDDLDIDNLPQTVRFQKIYSKLCVNIGLCEKELISKVIKEMLKGFVYFYYGRSLTDVLTSVGSKKTSSGNSQNTIQAATLLIKNYNYSVKTYQAIQEYICINSVNYPEFNGSPKSFLSII